MKQDDFVRLFQGVTVAMQKSYEGGKARPDVAYMDRLARYAGVSVGRLMDHQLTAKDVKLNEEEVEKVEPTKSSGFTADQLFAMFLEVSKTQTAILSDIRKEMAREQTQVEVVKKMDRMLANFADQEQVDILSAQFQEARFDEIKGLLTRLKPPRKGPSADEDNIPDETGEGVGKPRIRPKANK